jgi:hypothetical protein
MSCRNRLAFLLLLIPVGCESPLPSSPTGLYTVDNHPVVIGETYYHIAWGSLMPDTYTKVIRGIRVDEVFDKDGVPWVRSDNSVFLRERPVSLLYKSHKAIYAADFTVEQYLYTQDIEGKYVYRLPDD